MKNQCRPLMIGFLAAALTATACGSRLTLNPKMAFSRTRSLASWVTMRRSAS